MSGTTLRVGLLTPDETGWSAPPLSARTRRFIARVLAEALTAAAWQGDALWRQGGKVLRDRGLWFRPLIGRLLAAFPAGKRIRAARVTAYLCQDPGFCRAVETEPGVELATPRPERPRMVPAAGPPATWPVPVITTSPALAKHLGLEPGTLDWFADCQGRETRVRDGPLRHYRYRWQPKRNGSARLVESPKARLKAVQRTILQTLLAAIPPHKAAHGFRSGRSVATHIAPHVGQPLVLTLDLCDFFPSVTAARVMALFLTAGYPEPVAYRLSGLCTNRIPSEVWTAHDCPFRGPDLWRIRRLYGQPHLPQGAPTSPALANLAAYRLDARLAGLAAAVGASYTRYADDLTFSGDAELARCVKRLIAQIGAIALEEGFAVQHRKTRVMRQGVRQRVTGVVINAHPNLARPDYDTLKATLHNCVRRGPVAENRAGHPDFRAHLAGRIAHLSGLNPARGARLHALFDRITWPGS